MLLARSTTLTTISTLVSSTLSQAGFWALPLCSQKCIIQMLDLTSSPNLGCAYDTTGSPDLTCLCANANFKNGIRDCILQSCAEAWTNSYEGALEQVCCEYPNLLDEASTVTDPARQSQARYHSCLRACVLCRQRRRPLRQRFQVRCRLSLVFGRLTRRVRYLREGV